MKYSGNTYQDGEPTPEEESPVKVVTGENTVVVGNKNLFDKNNIINNIRLGGDGSPYGDNDYCTSDYLKIKNNTVYSNNKLTGSEAICIYDENKNFIKRWIGSNTTTITTTEKAYYCRVAILKTNLDVFQIEEGTTSTSYEEHKETRLPLNLGSIELCKIEEYKDYPWKDESTGKWYVKKLINKVVLNGSEDWSSAYTNLTDYFTGELKDIINDIDNSKTSLCNYFVKLSSPQTLEEGMFYLTYDNSKYFDLRLLKTRVTNLNDFKTWLSTHNLIVYYTLETPTDIEITNTTLINQLEAMKQATAYNDVTHISGSSDELSPIYKVQYWEKVT